MAVSLTVSFTVEYSGRSWRVHPGDASKVGGNDFVHISADGFAKLCFGELPNKWRTRSAGMQHLKRCRNELAFGAAALAQRLHGEPTPCKRPRSLRTEISAKRLVGSAFEVVMPLVVLDDDSHIQSCTLTMQRPVLAADALVVSASTEALAYCIEVVTRMGLSADDPVVKDELPRGCYWGNNRYVLKWFHEPTNKWCFKTFPAAGRSLADRAVARQSLMDFAINPHVEGLGDDVDPDTADVAAAADTADDAAIAAESSDVD